MKNTKNIGERAAQGLVLDELFDLTLYRRLHAMTEGELSWVLAELVPVEVKHLAFWQNFFDFRPTRLDFFLRVKMAFIVVVVRLLGPRSIPLILEAIEVYGVRKYLHLWRTYRGEPLGEAVKEILEDEIKHEDIIVSRIAENRINPEKIRSIILGFNDGLVEMLGAVAGFFAVFQSGSAVIVAWLTLTVAGSISMASGIYAAISSEKEVGGTEEGKREFLKEPAPKKRKGERPLGAAINVGVSYIGGSLIPIIPVFFGAQNVLFSIMLSVIAVVVVSLILSFLSGMSVVKRISINLAAIAIAVAVSYAVGTFARDILGISI